MFKDAFNKKKYFSIKPDAETVRNWSEGAQKMSGAKACPVCLAKISELDFIKNYKVCPHCGYHFTVTAWERIQLLADEHSFVPLDAELRSHNYLDFPDYDDKLRFAEEESGLNEAILTGSASLGGIPVIVGVMESRFMMASMGSVVGEKICRAVEEAIKRSCPLILCACSGGARMQEGMLSLMQMAKTSAVLNRFHQKGLLYISILTNPTTGGVSASFATLADIIIAEPGALVGFTGPRVIEQTLRQKLPEGFQRAEFLLEHGMIDLVIPRSELTSTLTKLVALHQGGNDG